jgi:cytochrome c peroxidase
MDSINITVHDKLVKEGWEQRSVLSEPRLSEVVKEYEELGFEVHLEPVLSNNLGTECNACFQFDKKSHVIYTRKRRATS